MESIDPRLLKWWGELLVACASNLEAFKRATSQGTEVDHWYDLWKSVPGFPEPPFHIKDIDAAQRMWLAVFDAVPRRDYDSLRERLTAVEEQYDKLRDNLQQITAAMTGMRNLPDTMAPWLEAAQATMKSHRDWLTGWGKSWRSGGNDRSRMDNVERS